MIKSELANPRTNNEAEPVVDTEQLSDVAPQALSEQVSHVADTLKIAPNETEGVSTIIDHLARHQEERLTVSELATVGFHAEGLTSADERKLTWLLVSYAHAGIITQDHDHFGFLGELDAELSGLLSPSEQLIINVLLRRARNPASSLSIGDIIKGIYERNKALEESEYNKLRRTVSGLVAKQILEESSGWYTMCAAMRTAYPLRPYTAIRAPAKRKSDGEGAISDSEAHFQNLLRDLGLSERQTKMATAILRHAGIDWFGVGDVEFTGIEFPNRGAFSSAFSIIARTLIQEGLIEHNGQRTAGRRYRLLYDPDPPYAPLEHSNIPPPAAKRPNPSSGTVTGQKTSPASTFSRISRSSRQSLAGGTPSNREIDREQYMARVMPRILEALQEAPDEYPRTIIGIALFLKVDDKEIESFISTIHEMHYTGVIEVVGLDDIDPGSPREGRLPIRIIPSGEA